MSAPAPLLEHAPPSPRDEAWRYTPVDDVLAALAEAGPPPSGVAAPSRALVDELAGAHGGPRLVLVNGRPIPELSDEASLPVGIWWNGDRDVQRLSGVREHLGDDDPIDGFEALNRAGADGATLVLIDPDVDLPAPLHLVHLAVPGPGTSVLHPRVAVCLAAGGRVRLLETFAGLDGRGITNASTRITVGAGASLTYHREQVEAAQAIHLGRTQIHQAAGSSVRATSVMAGAAIARSAIDVVLSEPGARVDLDGLYLPSGHQRHDNVITVDHAAPRCTSTQRFRGVIDDHARGSFSGHVIVRSGAAGTDATQSNRNLLLRPTAQADARPWLEIFADEVRCAHGATVGRLDDEALFYLRSRGIPLDEARAMLVSGFAAEIVDGIEPPSLRGRVADVLHQRGLGASR
jgi:Fe-S cluster assembly protein SufD